MKNTKKAGAFYLTALTVILAVVGLFLYKSVMYKMNLVYGFLAAVIVLGVLGIILAGKTTIANVVPILNAALMASAAVWSANLMVNQIGYVISGLDGMDTIQSFIVFCALAVVGMLLNIIASFMPMAKEA